MTARDAQRISTEAEIDVDSSDEQFSMYTGIDNCENMTWDCPSEWIWFFGCASHWELDFGDRS
jgi:hypothetical protein